MHTCEKCNHRIAVIHPELRNRDESDSDEEDSDQIGGGNSTDED